MRSTVISVQASFLDVRVSPSGDKAMIRIGDALEKNDADILRESDEWFGSVCWTKETEERVIDEEMILGTGRFILAAVFPGCTDRYCGRYHMTHSLTQVAFS